MNRKGPGTDRTPGHTGREEERDGGQDERREGGDRATEKGRNYSHCHTLTDA